MNEKAELPWALIEDQRRIIEEQRKIIEEQRRIINQHCPKFITSSCAASDTSSTAGSSHSLPATSISSGSDGARVSKARAESCSDISFSEALTPDVSKNDRLPSSQIPTISPRSPTNYNTLRAALSEDMRKDIEPTPSDACSVTTPRRGTSSNSSIEPGGLFDALAAQIQREDRWTPHNPLLTASLADHACDITTKVDHLPLGEPIPMPVVVQAQPLAATVPDGYGPETPHMMVKTSSQASTTQVDASFLNRELWKMDLGSWVLSANVSPRGRWLCTGSEDKTARIYDLVSKTMLQSFPHDGWVWSTQFSPDGLLLCTGAGDDLARIFDVETGRETLRLAHGGIVRAASLNASGKLLLTACQDKLARLFDAESTSLVRKFEHDGWVLSAAWSPEGSQCCTSSDDLHARVFDAETGRQQHMLEHDGWVRSATFSPDTKLLCTASDDKSARIFDLGSRVEIQRFEHAAGVASASLSPDGNYLSTACNDDHAYIFDLRKRIELLRFPHEGRVCSANFSPDGRRLCTASEDGHVRVFGYALQSMLSLIRMARADPSTPKAQAF